jgi:NAD(P)-dependent dehydrogenase (short-subunit alcohol dehydrogenase family)
MVGSFLATPAELFAMTTDATLNGTNQSMQAEALAMRDAGGGSIVNISSVAGARSGRWESAYSASKAGVDMLTKVAADEWGEHGIRVNSVLPGLIKTDTASPLTEIRRRGTGSFARHRWPGWASRATSRAPSSFS